jgi:aconitate hydratase
VIAVSYARIHRQNLINFGILPLEFNSENDLDKIHVDDVLQIENLIDQLKSSNGIKVKNISNGSIIVTNVDLSDHEKESILEGSLIALMRKKKK